MFLPSLRFLAPTKTVLATPHTKFSRKSPRTNPMSSKRTSKNFAGHSRAKHQLQRNQIYQAPSTTLKHALNSHESFRPTFRKSASSYRPYLPSFRMEHPQKQQNTASLSY